MSAASQKYAYRGQQGGWQHIAWAFLKVCASIVLTQSLLRLFTYVVIDAGVLGSRCQRSFQRRSPIATSTLSTLPQNKCQPASGISD